MKPCHNCKLPTPTAYLYYGDYCGHCALRRRLMLNFRHTIMFIEGKLKHV